LFVTRSANDRDVSLLSLAAPVSVLGFVFVAFSETASEDQSLLKCSSCVCDHKICTDYLQLLCNFCRK